MRYVHDERRFAPAVREWHPAGAQKRADRTELARILHARGVSKHEIALVLDVHWARIDRILAGEPGA